MKKVLFFLESLAGGGAEKVLSDLVSNLDKQKYDVTVCTVTDEGVYQDKVSEHCHYISFLNNRDYRAGGLRKIVYWIKMKLIYTLPVSIVYRWFIKEKYDVEIAFIEGYATKLIAASSNKKSKKLAWAHVDMSINTHADTQFKNIEAHNVAYNKFDQIFCVSESVKNAFVKKYFDSNKITVQYNPLDENAIVTMAQEPIELETTKHPLLGSIGRLEEQKGYLRLLECAKRLYKEGYQFEIWIIGEGTQRKQLESEIEKYQLESVFKLWGFQKNPYKYIRQCDAFICSSYTEGFSTAVTESLILGKPVFTVDCAGMQELFGNEKCGEIVENSDEALYELMKEIVSGKIVMQDYMVAVEHRGKSFCINQRIAEIEAILG